MTELPGNIHEKIGDLRIERGLTKKQMSADLGIPASQLTRIENGEIKSIGHELVIKIADYFNVSADYLLGRTSVRSCRNIDLDELGLSYRALVTLLSGKINTQLLSRIIEHKYFSTLMDYADAYFSGAHDVGYLNRNDVIDLAVTDITEYLKSHPEQKAQASTDIRQLRAEKVTGTEADLEKLHSILLKILKDVKKQYGEPVTDITAEEMREQVKKVNAEAVQLYKSHQLDEKTMASISAQILANQKLNLTPKDLQAFQNLVESILKNYGNNDTA